MAHADVHPDRADLEAFALGTLDHAALSTIAAHVADCPTCQQAAVDVAPDSVVDLFRRAHAQHKAADVVMRPTTTPPDALAGSRGSAETDDAVPGELTQHSRYRVVRLIGGGGMGTVYEAEHLVMQRRVALKVIKRSYLSSAGAVERFQREVRAAARLAHPNIVTAHDAEHAGDTHFLVMEYVEGITLGRLVREDGPRPVAEACDHVRQAALGLQHAHDSGMVHRDIKPDNLMLMASPVASAPGVVKVLDFGLAALAAEPNEGLAGTEAAGDTSESMILEIKHTLTGEGVLLGTPEYMAPEQADNPHGTDIRADIYGLGATLYYLLTGKVPYPAPTRTQKILAHREQPVPSPRRLRPEVPPELAAVVERMLAKKPEDRYQTPAEVAAVLEPFAAAESPAGAPQRRSRLFAALVALLLVGAAIAGVVVYRIQTDKGELAITTESEDVVVVIKQGGELVRVIDTKTEKSISLRSGVYELELQGDPNGLKLTTDKATLRRGETTLATIERVAKAPSPAPPARPAIQVVQSVRVPGNPKVYQTSAAPDGKLFSADVDHGRGTTIMVWDAQTGDVVRRFGGWLPTFTPDGKRFLFDDANVPGGIQVYDTATWKKVSASPAGTRLSGFTVYPGSRHDLIWTADHKMHLTSIEDGTILKSWSWSDGVPFWGTATDDGSVVFVMPAGSKTFVAWDVETNKPTTAFARLTNESKPFRILPGNKQAIVAGLEAGRSDLMDLANGERVTLPIGVWEPPWHIWEALLDPRIVLCGYEDGKLLLFDRLTGKERGTFEPPNEEKWAQRRIPIFGPQGRILSVQLGEYQPSVGLSPNGRYACVRMDQSVFLLRLPDPVVAKQSP